MQNNAVIRTEFAAAISQIAKERNIPVESIYDAIRQALVSAYYKQIEDIDPDLHIYAQLDPQTGESQLFSAPVVERDEQDEPIKWDESKAQDITPAGFGRIAAQTAKQVILQKIRESERDQIIADFSHRIGEVVSAQILRMQGRSVLIDLGRGQGYMPPEEQMRGEFYRVNSRLSVLIKEIRETHRGKVILVSRASKDLVAKLFEREVPEIATGAVEIVHIAREAGVRTKLTVRSKQEGVDPVGACVGQRGVRVQEVIRELNNEKLDIIPHSDDLEALVKSALAPAEGLVVQINQKKEKITVTASDEQLSLAIGRGGQNVRLAAKLLGWSITIQSAKGIVESESTGQEEYEIDTVQNLDDEVREFLVEHKLTTFGDIARFKDKWQQNEDISAEQKKILEECCAIFEREEAQKVSLEK